MTSQGPRDLPHLPELEDTYQLVRELGRGGSAVVYLARERELGRDVAIKLIRPAPGADEDAVARLVREARTVGKLQHPNIVMLLGTRRLSGGGLALILQFVPGKTLKEHIRDRGPLSVPQAEGVLRDLARALAYAHRDRIVHRDVKPENIYLDEEAGIARLADFGIARPWDSDSGLTLPGTAIGTPAYMSPEQVEGGRLDGRSDLYSLGLVAWEMLTGRQPWAGESLYEIIYKQKHEELPTLDEIRPDVPEHLRRAVERALRKDPDERWPTAGAFLESLSASSVKPEAPEARDDARADAEALAVASASSAPVSGAAGEREVAAEREGAREGGAGTGVAALFGLVLIGAVGAAAVTGVSQDRMRSLLGQILPAEQESEAPQAAPPGAVLPDAAPDASRGPLGGGLEDDPSEEIAARAAPPGTGVDAGEDALQAAGTPEDGGITLPGGPGGEDLGTDGTQPAPSAVRIAVIRGANQAGEVDSPLPQPLEIAVVDGSGDGIEGRWVRFLPVSGEGTLSADSVRTDADGIARVTWILGNQPGSHTVVAAVSGTETIQARITAEARPRGLAVRAGIVAGATHTCHLDTGGNLACWGGNRWGQLGDGGARRRLAPESNVTGGPFVRVESGLDHVCALDPQGTAYCWGSNGEGQLGDGTTDPRSQPVPVVDAPPMVELAAGAFHTCGETRAGAIYCWGANDEGQLGDGTTEARHHPVRVRADGALRGVAAGWRHTCALDDRGRAYCWGSNASGELGRSTQDPLTASTPISGTAVFTELSAGNAHTCGLGQDGRVYCWGSNANGQLGDGTSQSRRVPTPVESDRSFGSVAAGAVHTCALDSSGAAHCWGRNLFGQLGDETTTDRNRPVQVAGSATFERLHAFGSHTCGRTAAGETHCWGYNSEGQLGDGTRQDRNVPVRTGAGAAP